MSRVSIVKVDNVLIATVQDELSDREALEFQQEVHEAIERTGAHGVLLDLTSMQTIDSFLGRFLNEVAAGSRLLGAEAVVAGVQPAVAITLVELGLQLVGVTTVLSAERGMQLLRSRSRV